MTATQFHAMPDGRRIAFRKVDGMGPLLVFLPGYMSDMAGGKATALFDWAQGRGRACLLLDYSGCGESSGEFADGTLSRWCDEVVALIGGQAGTDMPGSVMLIGSSMGGWLMLLAALALGDRTAGLIGIAAAPDFSDWGYSPSQKALLRDGATVLEDNPYGPDPTPTYSAFWKDAETHRLLGHSLAITAPVRLLHGQRDADVPWQVSLQLADALRSDGVQVALIKDGDHRLSRPGDIALLLRNVQGLLDDLQMEMPC